ncbi:MAG: hypothetical protein NTX82_00190 [Candidatus Parcubacteria bacterium]|nr:hypothetical protein [Candidatus Parcubacteria bacterium]
MKNKILFSGLLLIASLILSSIQVWAQELPPGESIPTGPSEADIANYQQEFGVNLQDVVPKDDIIKPVFEEPQTVPDEVKEYATDADRKQSLMKLKNMRLMLI